MDVRAAVEEYRHAKLRLSQHTLRGYMQRLSVFVAWCEQQGLTLEALTTRHIRIFVEEVSKLPGKKGGEMRNSTLRMYTAVVKSFLAWCAKAEQLLAVDTPFPITFLFMLLTQHKRRSVERFLAITRL